MGNHVYSFIFVLWFSILIFAHFVPPAIHAQGKEGPKWGGTYRRPLEFGPKTLDPALAADIYSVTVIQQLFDGLIQFDKDLNVIPAIAKSWKISPDGLTYTFYLRPGVKFHHGREVNAEDFLYTFTRIVDPRIKSPAAQFLDRVMGFKEFQNGSAINVKGFSAPEKHTFMIRLSEPYSPLISILGMNKFKVLPKEEVEKTKIDFGKSPIGTGAFKFISMREGEEIILEANPDYWEGKPFLDRIIFKISHGATRERILKEFKEGGLEESFIPPGEIENILNEKRYPFLQKPILSLRFYGFNLSSKPLTNGNLRKAINFAIDKKSIISQVHQNQFQLAKGILPPGMPGYDPRIDPYPFNEALARKHFSGGGFEKGKDIPVLEVWSASASEAAQRELNEISSQLRRIGIPSHLNFETNWPVFESMLISNKCPVFLYAWYADFPDPDNFLGTLFHSRSKYNYAAYQNLEVDRLIDLAKTERDYLKRIEMYRKIERMVLEDAPIVPMVTPLFQMVYQPYVKGMEVNALGGPYIPMKKIWLSKGN